ncbi:MmgE/PrpD family protein [Paracoccus sp. P2]|uniref:MmgE/PrpD family protein n=1 Tax=Paracoccus sp. P2 TaxID=3248840 RepID=UPI00391F5A7B
MEHGRMTNCGATRQTAGFVATLDAQSLPQAVHHEVLRAFVNGVGCLVGGAGHEMTARAATVLLPHAGQPTAFLLGQGVRTDLLTASLINGLAGAAYSFDDTYGEAMLHPSGPVLAAILALAEARTATGIAFLAAYAGALEISCRLTRALTVAPAQPEMAWSQTGVVAGIGAALGCGRLLGLDAAGLETAIGIAASEAAGTRAAHGSMAASLIFGRAAQSGLRAALLAEGGFTASPGMLEHASGFAHVFAAAAHLPALTEGLGMRFELLGNTYKPYPCGVVIHPAIDAVLYLRNTHAIDEADITRIVLQVSPRAMKLAFRPEPSTDIEAKVSLHHWVAVAAARGRAGIAEGRPEVVADPVIAALRRKVEASGADDLEPTQARLMLELRDGRQLEHMVQACAGSAARPMTDEELSEKCRQQAEMVIGARRATALTDLCWKLASLADAADVARAAS